MLYVANFQRTWFRNQIQEKKSYTPKMSPINKKEVFACFECRKVFEHQELFLNPQAWPWYSERAQEFHCPECKGSLQKMKSDFHPPKSLDLEEWKALKTLYKCGFRFLGRLDGS